MGNTHLDQVMLKITELDAQRSDEISDIMLIIHPSMKFKMDQHWMYWTDSPGFWNIDKYTIQVIRTTDLSMDDAIIISSRGITKFKFTNGEETNTMS